MPRRRRRSDDRLSPFAFMNPFSKSKAALQSKLSRAARSVIEPLEDRVLFTTLTSTVGTDGDVFEWQDSTGKLQRAAVSGNITVELIGAAVTGSNSVFVTDMPGQLTHNGVTTDVLGGIGGANGLRVIGPTTITDPINGAGGTFDILPSTSINLQALASNDLGTTYAFNVVNTGVSTLYQVVQLNTSSGAGTVVLSLSAGLHAGTDAITAADFGPNGLLYFVAHDSVTDINGVVTARSRLYTLDVTNGTVTPIIGTFGTTDTNISSIAFDNNGNLLAMFSTADACTLATVSATNSNSFGIAVTVTVDGENVTDIGGIEVIPGDNNVYATTTSDAEIGAQLLAIDRSTGAAVILGPLPATDETGDAIDGNSLQGLTWNPTFPNSFSGESGALLATDTATDNLVVLDNRNRFPKVDLFQVYVAQSDETGTIAIAEVPKADPKKPFATRDMTPFTDSIGSIRVNNLDPEAEDPTILVNAPANSGSTLIGALTQDVNKDVDDEDKIPITQGSLNQAIGVRPNPNGTITSGLVVAAGQNLGRFLLGGTIMGAVDAAQNLGFFYAGWIITGNAQGELSLSDPNLPVPSQPNNFHVGGDLRNLLTTGSIGTDKASSKPIYVTGFDLQVGGVIGQIRTLDGWIGAASAAHASNVTGISTGDIEIETNGPQKKPDPTAFQQGEISSADFRNDTFDTAQYLGGFVNTSIDPSGAMVAQVSGVFDGQNGDAADFFGIALMAGQTVTVSLQQSFNSEYGIYDPDQRLIFVGTSAYRFTADRPGVYRVVVGQADDEGDFTTNDLESGEYTLRITNIGDLAVGGLVADSAIFDGGMSSTFEAQNGDWGALVSTGDSILASSGSNFFVDNGNLRAIEATEIGEVDPDVTSVHGTFLSHGINLNVVSGSVGLVHSTTGVMLLNLSGDSVVGQNYQVIDAATTFGGQIIANGSLGVLRAGDMDTDPPSVITVNADGVGFDGTIDLIDVSGDFGTLDVGGPQITTGPGGDVRYIHVGGTAFRDSFFGGGSPDTQLFDPGEAVTLTDDSGANFTLTPTGGTLTTTTDPTTGQVTGITTDNSLTIRTYGIRGSGGVVLIDVEASSGSMDVSSSGSGEAVEIGSITVSGAGAPVIQTTDAKGKLALILDPNSTADSSLNFTGSATIDVLNIIANGPMNSINNSTSEGEIVNVQAGTIGTLQASTIGLAKNSTGAAVNPIDVVSDDFPFVDQHIGVTADQIAEVRSRRGLGNLIVGSIGQVRPNSDGQDVAGTFEGINAPILASGDLFDVNIGEGLLPSGFGEMAFSGIFANGVIHKVTNQGLGSDIRGNIISTVANGIESIQLTDGAIINSKIAIFTDLTMSRSFATLVSLPTSSTTVNPKTFDLGSIQLNGKGGILGSTIRAATIGNIDVNGGFGILNTFFDVSSNGKINRVRADGYGIRRVSMIGGSQLGTLQANGNGSLVSTATFTSSVRLSETNSVDPFSGIEFNSANDLHAFLGTSAIAPVIPGVTDTGIIEDVDANGQGSLNTVRAFSIRERLTGAAPSAGSEFGMQLNFANSIKSIKTTGPIDGLNITTGRLKEFKPASDVSRLGITVSGKVSSVTLPGSLSGNSFIHAIGHNGSIGTVKIKGNLDGDVSASKSIDTLQVNGNINGSVNIDGLSTKKKVINTLKLGGSVADGSLTINGSAGSIKAKGTLGSPGDQLVVNGNLDLLQVGGNLFSNVTIRGNLKKAKILGTFASGVTMAISNVLSSITINGDFSAGAVIEAAEVKKKKVLGQDLGTIIIT